MSDSVEAPIGNRLGDALRDEGHTVAVAESCTGGLVGSLITDVPGASDYFDRSICTYTYDAKLDLGIAREMLDEHGAVSEPVAREMARRARDRSGTTWAVSTTGIAGPTGGSEETPVGTVFIGVARAADWGSNDSYTTVSHHLFDGTRTEIKRKIARQALQDILQELQG
ncbi:MAG: CinA family protein [Halobacteriaceae archaeon]